MNNVQAQYKTADKLNTRISIHAKYSTNHQPFGDWIASHYRLSPGDRILELGCGTGDIWKDRPDLLPEGSTLILTDFSPGMLETAKANVSDSGSITFQTVDIQDIPFPEHSFDVVIANMMLYHVPDLHRGLSEVRRVLKPGGAFYCATFGICGVHGYVTDLLQDLGVTGKITGSFTLQNGEASLDQHFSAVTRLDREDGLAITDIQDFADYIYSLAALENVESIPRDVLVSKLESRVQNGVLFVPKEYGMFICK